MVTGQDRQRIFWKWVWGSKSGRVSSKTWADHRNLPKNEWNMEQNRTLTGRIFSLLLINPNQFFFCLKQKEHSQLISYTHQPPKVGDSLEPNCVCLFVCTLIWLQVIILIVPRHKCARRKWHKTPINNHLISNNNSQAAETQWFFIFAQRRTALLLVCTVPICRHENNKK